MVSFCPRSVIAPIVILLVTVLSSSLPGQVGRVARNDIEVRHILGRTQFVILRNDGTQAFAFVVKDDGDLSPVINHWIFGNTAVAERKRRMETAIAALVERTCETYQLNEEHQQKLLIAGRADIRSFYESAERLKQQFQTRFDQNGAFNFSAEDRKAAEALCASYNHFPFRQSDSLYAHALNRILATERLAPRPLIFLEGPELIHPLGDAGYYESLVDLVDQVLDDARLRERQRSLLALMLHRQLQGKFVISLKDPLNALRKLAELPESTWKSALDQAQWERLNKKFQKLRDVDGKK